MMKTKSKPDVGHYMLSVIWSEQDQSYLAKAAEFESLIAHGETQEEAMSEMKALLTVVLEDLSENNEAIPEPFSMKNYSGKLNLRMPEALHRQLSIEASQQGVSLNQLINLKLAASAKGLI